MDEYEHERLVRLKDEINDLKEENAELRQASDHLRAQLADQLREMQRMAALAAVDLVKLREAFWSTFAGSGEWWFPYGGEGIDPNSDGDVHEAWRRLTDAMAKAAAAAPRNALLKKYIKHVTWMEGCSFLEDWGYRSPILDKSELAVLRALAAEPDAAEENNATTFQDVPRVEVPDTVHVALHTADDTHDARLETLDKLLADLATLPPDSIGAESIRVAARRELAAIVDLLNGEATP